MENEVGKIRILDENQFRDEYNTELGGRRRWKNYVSPYHVPEFDVALALAKDNPNKFIKFFELSNTDLQKLKSQTTSAQSYYKAYFKRENLTDYFVTRRTQGNKVTFFLSNAKSEEE
tara:strand:- start:5249 stop:5599 length:351 start_codon:yes stop_codon:yes gene_type:complete